MQETGNEVKMRLGVVVSSLSLLSLGLVFVGAVGAQEESVVEVYKSPT